MRRQTQRWMLSAAQILAIGGLGVAALWNGGSLLFALPGPGWWGLVLPWPGLLLWLGAQIAPGLLARPPAPRATYRLVYSAGDEWSDETARRALLNLAGGSGGLGLTWVREGSGAGCWLSVAEAQGAVLGRLVADIFPSGSLEADSSPEPGEGAVILRPTPDLPSPDALCRLEGIEGAHFQWKSHKTAVVSLWGPGAMEAAHAYAREADLLPGRGKALLRPKFSGHNPWPAMPPFPPSKGNPGLEAVSRYEAVSPLLRVKAPALVVGRDRDGEPVGFGLPDLAGAKTVYVLGEAAGRVAVSLAQQAIEARLPVFFLDGQGAAAARLAQRSMRAVALGQVLLCDLERPAQSRFRLNPFWLPPERADWPRVLPAWRAYLGELGMTPGGLGQAAYNHTLAAVTLTALAASDRQLILDPPGLRDALAEPDFLTRLDEAGAQPLLEEAVWAWWQESGRHAPNFDVHLRLGHLRDRLAALMDLPQYRVLWQGPYLEPLTILENRNALLWRCPDHERRLQPYLTSQLLALCSLFAVWPPETPALVVLAGLNPGLWAGRLSRFPAVRLVLAAEEETGLRAAPAPETLLVSRLGKADAEGLSKQLPGLRPADLRRLPAERLIVRRGQALGTVAIMGDGR